nr:hypothetical protein [Tanacetum cinerariifolium]
MSDMTSLLNDLSYILLNNEHNEPTQGEIGETSNEPTQATRNEFEELYASANEELYPGCDYVSIKHHSDHITIHRFDLSYKTWVHHGEPALPPPPLVIDNIRQPQMSDMTTLLNDLSYIPPNNEHNEPTQGDIGETSNEPTQATRNEFEELYASANEELYLGCDYFFQNVFPISKGYKLPPSYYAIKKTFKTIGLGYESIHACEHDCCLFRAYDNKDLDFCPSSHTAKEMIWHATGKCMEPSKMQHPVDGRAWTNFDTKPLIEDLKVLWDRKGVETIDVAFGQKFNMRAMVLWTINDFPARSSLSGWSGQGKTRLAKVRHSKWLVAWPNQKGKCLKPQVAYSFTPENRKKFCQFIKGVKLPDGFGSCFKHKVTDNDTNITGLKSHDCHIMMQRLLSYGLQNYLPDKIAKPIIELCSLFKQICSATLMEDDILKAQIKVFDILCYFELIYPPALFDIMIHFVIHLPLEALEGGPIRPRWMYPFERYMKKLKGYVRNKAKPEGSIAGGYVVEEALTFSSHYFRDVTTKFNHLDRNVDPPLPTCQFQIRQHHVDNDKDPEVSTTGELFALACGPIWTLISINSCVVDGVRYVVHNRDERCITQNSGICSPGPDGEMYYGQLQEILEFKAESFKDDQYILVTQVKQVFYLEDKAKPYWRVVEHVNHKKFSDGGVIVVEDDLDIIHFDNSSDLPLSTSLNDLDNATLHIDSQSTEVDVPLDIIIDVVDEDDDITDDEDVLPHDLAEFDNEDLINVDDDGVDKMSADFARSYGGDGGGKGKRKPNLGGRAAGRMNTRDKTQNLSLKKITDTKGPVPIQFELRDKQTVMPLGDHMAHWSSYIEEVIRDDDITDDEDALPHDLAECDNEDLINVDDDGVDKMSADVSRSHDGDGGGKGKRKLNLGGRAAGRLNTREKTRNLSLKEITDTRGPVPIQFELRDKQTVMLLGDHAAPWSSYIREVIRGVPLYYPYWLKVPNERKAALITDIGMQTSTTEEYPSLIDTFFVAHTVNGEFLRDEDRRIYDEMRRLEAMGTYTDDEINRLARGGKQRGHIAGMGRVLSARATASPSTPAHDSTLNSLHKKVDFMISIFKSDLKYPDMFSQFELGDAGGSGGYGDEEEGVIGIENAFAGKSVRL